MNSDLLHQYIPVSLISGATASSRSSPPYPCLINMTAPQGNVKDFSCNVCNLYIVHHPADFFISLLTGKALDWVTVLQTAQSSNLSSESRFHTLFKEVFDHSVSGRHTGDLLCELRQGRRSSTENALEFRSMAAGSCPCSLPRGCNRNVGT